MLYKKNVFSLIKEETLSPSKYMYNSISCYTYLSHPILHHVMCGETKYPVEVLGSEKFSNLVCISGSLQRSVLLGTPFLT